MSRTRSAVRRRITLCALIGASFASIATAVATAGSVEQSAGSPYKVSMTMDLSGPISFNGKVVAAGFQAAVAYINKSGGINGRQISLNVMDDASDVAKGRANVQQAIDDHSLAIFGFILSNVSSAAQPLANDAQIPLIATGSASVASLNPVQKYYYSYDLSATAHAILKYIGLRAQKAHIAKPRIALFTVDTVATRQAVADATAEIQSRGWTIADQEYMPVAPTDVTAQAASIARSNPDFVFMVHNDGGALVAVRGLRAQGVKVPVVNVAAGSADATLSQLGTNYVALRTFVSPRDTSFPAVRQMRKNATSVGYADLMTNSYFTEGWVAGRTLGTTLKKCGACPSGVAFAAAMDKLGKLSTGGLSGPLTVSPQSHGLTKYVKFYTWSSTKNNAVPATGLDWLDATS